MNQKAEKPTLSGHRLKTRKRDEKEKYDPTAFRDVIIQGLNEAGTDLGEVSKFLDSAGGKVNYRRYAEVLLDILFAGGQLAPGGSIVQDQDPTKVSRTDVCVFSTEETQLKPFFEVFNRLIRRYKYLEKGFEDELKKILVFLKGFKEHERRKLAIITGHFLATGFCSAKVLVSLFEDHLVKDGLALEFATMMFESWLQFKDMNVISAALKRAQMDTKLMELLPFHKRNIENFDAHFSQAGLTQIVDYQKLQQNHEVKKELQTRLREFIDEEKNPKEMAEYIVDEMKKSKMGEQEVTLLVWNTLMAAIEWNKKEELVAEQALKHIRMYSPIFAAVAKAGKTELALLVRIQDYCYDNMSFLKVFQKIVVLLYKTEVLSEDVILKWYKDGHSPKGKSVFLDQMKKFVEWLNSAEEEESEEEDD